jgi:two-component system cell cycle sensor histidine kinase/response regulator CckA
MRKTEHKSAETFPSEPQTGSKTILIVDDEAKMRKILHLGLSRHGYAILEACDGAEALRVCKEHEGKIHLLLLDVVMPGMSGLELAPRVLALRPEIQVIFMSGHSDEDILLHGSLNPSAPFFHKPFTLDDLVRKVRDVLQLSI